MLKGKTALVTGSSRGIGKAIALEFARNGARVIVNYKNNQQQAENVVKEIQSNGGQAISIKADVSKVEEVKSLFEQIKQQWGLLDILVNNAGILKDNLVVNITDQDWDETINTNLKGTFNCLREAVKMMIINPSGGKIVNVTSVVGIYGNAGQAAYCSTKAGIIGLTKSAAKELGEVGITVNALAPGITDTDMLGSLSKQQISQLSNQTSLKRIGRPEEIAKGALFLASELSSYVTGQVLVIDGGMII